MIAYALFGVVSLATAILAASGDLPSWAGGPITAGLVCVLLITGQLAPGKLLERERDERLKAQEREREAYRVTVPAVLAGSQALDRVLQVLPALEKPPR